MSRSMILRGVAHDEKETFDFEIWQAEVASYSLYITYHGDCCQNVTGAGIWPSVEKAKLIAQQTANELLHGAIIDWIVPK